VKKKKCFKCGYWNAGDALYCTLCYEPFNKKPAPAPAEKQLQPPAARPGPVRQPLKPLLLKAILLALVVSAAGTALYVASRPPASETAAAKARGNRFKDKTDAAEKLLADNIQAKEALLTEISAAAPDPEGFGPEGRYTRRLIELIEAYPEAINALALPCPTCVDEEKDAVYLNWTEEHKRREAEAFENFSRRYQAVIEKQLAGK